MENQEIALAFQPLWGDIDLADTFPARRPLLAHYTSLEVLESIMASDSLWFSNPLYMNDLEELRFGLNEGRQAFLVHDGIRQTCGNDQRYAALRDAFEHHFQQFDVLHAFDTYVLCFSEHLSADNDGLLSMWRGYGGNGAGVAIVLDSAQINTREDTPFVISQVTYASAELRRQWIAAKLDEFAGLVSSLNLPDMQLGVAAYMLLERIKMFALFTKHNGFKEEHEWRAVYLNQRDLKQRITPMLSYHIGRRGIEPKLKFKVAPIPDLTDGDLSLNKLIQRIILGPSISGVLAINSVKRMLRTLKKPEIAERVIASSTPFRS